MTHSSPIPASWRPRLRDSVRLETTTASPPRHLIYDAEVGRYCNVGPDAMALAQLLDGSRPFADLVGGYGPTARENLTRFLVRLIELGLVDSTGLSISHETARTPTRRGLSQLAWSRTDCAPLFAALRPLARVLFSPAAAIALLAFLAAGGWALTTVADGVMNDVRRSPSAAVVAASIVVMALLTFIHELAHGLALTRFGGRVNRMGVMLVYLFPAAFCDVSDGYRLASRFQRAVVALAGAGVQLVAIAASALALRSLGPDAPADARQLLAYVLFMNTTLVVTNLLPFVRFDGYWALVAALDEPNLRTRSMSAFRDTLRRLLTGIPSAKGSRAPGRAVVTFGAGCAIAPPVLVLIALVEWGLLFGQFGAPGALIWLTLLTALLVVLVRFTRRAARELTGLHWRRRVRAISVVVAAMAVVGITLLVASPDTPERLTALWWQLPLHRLFG
jgi:putative peptide zinc metalloprotease protein